MFPIFVIRIETSKKCRALGNIIDLRNLVCRLSNKLRPPKSNNIWPIYLEIIMDSQKFAKIVHRSSVSFTQFLPKIISYLTMSKLGNWQWYNMHTVLSFYHMCKSMEPSFDQVRELLHHHKHLSHAVSLESKLLPPSISKHFQPLVTTNMFFISIILSFHECHIHGVIYYVIFGDCPFHSS